MSLSPSFRQLGLSEPLLIALDRLGFSEPTPVQAACIPALLGGRDVLGEAQTGTGKTGAFGLPLINAMNPELRAVQALVLAPTRELANQVAAALTDFASGLRGLDIVPVYGGQPMSTQMRRLHAGAQVVVGTPGRIVDHIKRGTLTLDALRLVVLDEADEMLRMGFIEDIEWILEQTPPQRQTALFSATMPAPIRRIAHRHLRSPEEIRVGAGNEAGADIEQRYCIVDSRHKLEALSRWLEVEPGRDAAIVFARTKAATQEIADAIARGGHKVAALNGDMDQKERERVVAELRDGRLDVIVATDVAARGIDVPRISHVFNFDAPGDAEAYVHRIGRTGRAGRKGSAILFLEPRQRRILREIESLTRRPVRPQSVPDLNAVAESRLSRFASRVDAWLAREAPATDDTLVTSLLERCRISERDLARALLALATEQNPLVPAGQAGPDPLAQPSRGDAFTGHGARGAERRRGHEHVSPAASRPPHRERPSQGTNVRYYIPMGRRDGIGAREIVGALTHEGGMQARDIGRIGLMDHYSHVELPATVSENMIRRLARIHVGQRRLEMSLEMPDNPSARPTPTASRVPAGFSGARVPMGGPAPSGEIRRPSGARGAPGNAKSAAGKGPGYRTGPKNGKAPGARGAGFTARNSGTLAVRRRPA